MCYRVCQDYGIYVVLKVVNFNILNIITFYVSCNQHSMGTIDKDVQHQYRTIYTAYIINIFYILTAFNRVSAVYRGL